MPVSKSFAELLQEALSPLGPVSVRAMFGGGGVYCDGVMFALVSDDVLYLKVDDGTKATFEAEGCGPFVYQGKGRPIAMSYWRMPDRLLDDHEEMAAWAAGALAVARQGAAAKSEAAPRAGKASAGPPRSTPGRKR